MNMFDFARIIHAKTKLVYSSNIFSLKIVYRPHNYLQSGAYVSLSFLNLLNNLKQCILTKIREVDQLPFTKLCEFEMLSKWQCNNHTYTQNIYIILFKYLEYLTQIQIYIMSMSVLLFHTIYITVSNIFVRRMSLFCT